MNQFCRMAFRKMEEETISCRKKQHPPQHEIEACFAITSNYWNQVKQKLITHHFKTDGTEIEFFKTLKPKFTSQIEYYCLLYHACLFQPQDNISAINFWSREYRRLENYLTENKSFVRCYRDEACELLPFYFLRRFYLPGQATQVKIYDDDNGNLTNGDPLVSTLLALIQFQQYVYKKLETLY